MKMTKFSQVNVYNMNIMLNLAELRGVFLRFSIWVFTFISIDLLQLSLKNLNTYAYFGIISSLF